MTPLAAKLTRASRPEAAVQAAYLASVYRGQLRRRADALGLKIDGDFERLSDKTGYVFVGSGVQYVEQVVKGLERRKQTEAVR